MQEIDRSCSYLDLASFDNGAVQFLAGSIGIITRPECNETKTLGKTPTSPSPFSELSRHLLSILVR
jgi:hypothetical protein